MTTSTEGSSLFCCCCWSTLVPSSGGYLSPSMFSWHGAAALRKAIRGILPHFAVVVGRQRRRVVPSQVPQQRRSVAERARPLSQPGATAGVQWKLDADVASREAHRPNHRHQSSKGGVQPPSRLANIVGHLIREIPLRVIDFVCLTGCEGLSWLPYVGRISRHNATQLVVSRHFAESLKGFIDEEIRPSSRVPDETRWALLLSLMPARLVAVVSIRGWLRSLLLADESFIAHWLRSQYIEKRLTGLVCRMGTLAIIEPMASMVTMLLIRPLIVGSCSSGEELVVRPPHDAASRCCIVALALIAGATRVYVVPAAAAFAQRSIIWLLESVDYVITRRYADRSVDTLDALAGASNPNQLLTVEELENRQWHLQQQQRHHVIKAIAVRAVAMVATRVAVVHPLATLAFLIESKAVMVCFDVVCFSPAPVMSLTSIGNQVFKEVRLILGLLQPTDDSSKSVANVASLNGDPLVSSVNESVVLLLRAVAHLTVLMHGWQWALASALLGIHFSTLGRVNLIPYFG